MGQLVMAVHLTDPHTHRPVVLLPGEEPAPHLAELITNPAAWQDGQVPGRQDDSEESDDGTKEAAPAAKKPAARKPAATKPARGRDAAEQGTSGE